MHNGKCFPVFWYDRAYKPGSVLTAIYLAPQLLTGSSHLLGTAGQAYCPTHGVAPDRVYIIKPMSPWAGCALTAPFHPCLVDASSISLAPPQAAGLVHSAASPLSTEPAALGFGRISCSPAHRRNVRFWAFGGYAPGCARKIGHSRGTRLTRADRRFSAAPVGTLPTAFGCVPARIPRPALQAFARKTAGWRTEWAGACTEDSRFVFDHPA